MATSNRKALLIDQIKKTPGYNPKLSAEEMQLRLKSYKAWVFLISEDTQSSESDCYQIVCLLGDSFEIIKIKVTPDGIVNTNSDYDTKPKASMEELLLGIISKDWINITSVYHHPRFILENSDQEFNDMSQGEYFITKGSSSRNFKCIIKDNNGMKREVEFSVGRTLQAKDNPPGVLGPEKSPRPSEKLEPFLESLGATHNTPKIILDLKRQLKYNPKFVDENNNNLLHLAALAGRQGMEIINMIAADKTLFDELIQQKNKKGQTPLPSILLACLKSGNLKISENIYKILEKSDLNIMDKNNRNLIYYAYKSFYNSLENEVDAKRFLEIVTFLHQQGAVLDQSERTKLITELLRDAFIKNKFGFFVKLLQVLPATERESFLFSTSLTKSSYIVDLMEFKQWDSLNAILKTFNQNPIENEIIAKGPYHILLDLKKKFPGKTKELDEVIAQYMNRYYVTGNAKELSKIFEDQVKAVENEPLLLYGPLFKNKYTLELEKLAHYILNNEKINFLTKEDGKFYAEATINGKLEVYNLTDILEYANYEHLDLSAEDMEQYTKMLNNGTLTGSSNLAKEGELRNKLPAHLQPLSYAEMQAINIYTGKDNYFARMVSFQVGDFESLLKEKYPVPIKDLLVHTVVCSSGLKKVAANVPVPSPLPIAYRSERTGGTIFVKERVKQIELAREIAMLPAEERRKFDKEIAELPPEKRSKLAASISEGGAGVTYVKRFMSSSLGCPDHAFLGHNVRIIFQDGLIGNSIAAISKIPTENEFLLLPGQIRWLGHLSVGGKDYFLASSTRTISKLPEKALSRAEDIPAEILNSLTFNIHILLESFKEMKNDFIKNKYDQQYIDLIEDLVITTQSTLDNNKLNAQHKLKIIVEKFNQIKSALQNLKERKSLASEESEVVEDKFGKKLQFLKEISFGHDVNIHFGNILSIIKDMNIFNKNSPENEKLNQIYDAIRGLMQNKQISCSEILEKLDSILNVELKPVLDDKAHKFLSQDRKDSKQLREMLAENFSHHKKLMEQASQFANVTFASEGPEAAMSAVEASVDPKRHSQDEQHAFQLMVKKDGVKSGGTGSTQNEMESQIPPKDRPKST